MPEEQQLAATKTADIPAADMNLQIIVPSFMFPDDSEVVSLSIKNVSSMNFNLLKIIEFPLRSRT